jgi:hypothetical protein
MRSGRSTRRRRLRTPPAVAYGTDFDPSGCQAIDETKDANRRNPPSFKFVYERRAEPWISLQQSQAVDDGGAKRL